ncbi:DUF3857 domain-containing protein [bacterium]|nr:DUF3857 domain-containing protein [bacterium]
MLQLRTRITIVVLSFLLTIRISAQTAADYVQSAWDAWHANGLDSVETLLNKALELDPSNIRAHLGLSYYYQLMEQKQLSWKHYRSAFEQAPDPEPYIYAGMIAPRMLQLQEDKKSGIIDLYKTLAENAKHSTMRASATEITGRYYQDHNKLREAQTCYAGLHAVTDWLVIGPFDNISASGFERVFPPETGMEPETTVPGKNDVPASWFKIEKLRHDQWVDFRRYFSQTDAVFYANTFVYVPEKQAVHIRVGTSGAVKVFLNDEQVLEWVDENNNDMDTYIAATELQQGWNRLLVKCGFSEITQCNFMVRITDPDGDFIESIQIDSSPRPYQSKPGAPVVTVPQFAESFFEKQIGNRPDDLENYLLLADCLLRNDKAIEAELILRESLKKSPDNILILSHLIEAYQRGEKFDEIMTTLEKLSNLAPDIPVVLDYKFNDFMENEEYEKAAACLETLKQVLPESPELDQYRVAFHHAKNEPEKVIALTREIAKKYPDNWAVVKADAYLSLYITKNPDQAIKKVRKFLKTHTQDDVFNTMMDLYLKAGDFKKWEETGIERTRFNPAATGYYFDMVETYKTMQNYPQAESLIRQTIDICPGSALYHASLAEILRASGRVQEAVTAYENALTYNPAFYDARDKLRELQDKSPVFDRFEGADIDSMIQAAPGAEMYPDDGAVILYNDAKRVVYERGASESREELLVKVFNAAGIDQFKEYWIEYNPYTEKLIIEKAVVIKKDGSEINADQRDNQLVFKTLEENDILYLKWKIRNFYTGKLSNHFWDSFYFNAYYPVRDIRYAILIPREFKFEYKTQFMSETPASVRETEDGMLFQWRLADEPAVQYEYRMPGLDDIGKMLHISSIPDWAFIVDWYTDLAKTKTRSSYEIRETVHQLLGEAPLPEAEKIRRIHHFITENIRYSFVSFRQSGLIPQKARDVLVNRIGDCKDMATLAIAMLKEAGIEAHYVIVNTRDEGLRRHNLPGIQFNHAIARAETENGPLYMDLTAQNYAVGTVPEADMGAFSLDIRPGVAQPSILDPDLFIKRELRRGTKAVIHEDNSIAIQINSIRTGSFAAQTRQAYRFMGQKDREKTLLENLNRDYPNLELHSFVIDHIDSVAPDIHYTYDFSMPQYINDAGSFKIMKMPWTDALRPDRALSYDKRQYTYEFWPSTDLEEEEIDCELPGSYVPVELPSRIHYTCPVADYTLTLSFKNGTIRAKRMYAVKKWEVPPEMYAGFKAFYNNVLKADQTQILLKK